MELIRDENVEDVTVDDSEYNVVMYNDDVTPFEYVIAVLHTLFGKNPNEGFQIALHIHQNGSAILLTTTMKEAYDKVEAVDEMNTQYGYLLQTNVEKA